MTQWNQTPQPAPEPKKPSRRVWLALSAAVLLVVAVIAIAVAANSDDTYGGSGPNGREGTHQSEDVPAAPQKDAQPREPASAKDVQLKSFTFDTSDLYGDLEPSGGQADLKVTNHSSKTSDYLITVEVTAPNGDRIATLNAAADGVRPGQTVDTGEEDATGTEHLTPVSGAKATVTDVIRDASLNEDGTEKGTG
jgi:hypothetical protein